MVFEINLQYKNESLIQGSMENNTTIQDLIDFVVEAYPLLFKEQDRARILIQSRSFKIYLNPKHNLEQILGQKQDEIFDIEINQQSEMIGIKPNQNQQQIKIQFLYNGQSLNCEIDDDTTLEYIFIDMKQHFNITEQVYFKLNEVNLSELPEQTTLKDLKLNDQNRINIISASQIFNAQIVQQEVQGKMDEIQFLIEDGLNKKICVLNCGSEQTLDELKIEILNYIGIKSVEIAQIEFFMEIQRLLDQNQQNQYWNQIQSKLRYQLQQKLVAQQDENQQMVFIKLNQFYFQYFQIFPQQNL